ncbi:agmatinase, mitochondrial-like isoform X2 [Acanthaster planci]|nr:agmatinase, mitochondrial-like isoform X2 [Acanthaster planci]XP_022095333.1 agmatinase, mitochondrial-like isoform X2 [Acanthaster planci]XP_022095334.1 agmatinase, mitochondrial-like isoform X2 [Acanthaster planci]
MARILKHLSSPLLRPLKPFNYGSVTQLCQISSSCRSLKSGRFNEPLSGMECARAGGIATMYRLPFQEDPKGLDVCFVGIPLDIGTSNRSGARLGPRQIRMESVLVRNISTIGAAPYESLQVADIGDININLYDLKKTVQMIKEAYVKIFAVNCTPLTLGGDHTLTYPILQAVKEKYGQIGLVHVDAHNDCEDIMLGEKIAHGTPFRRSLEEGIIDPKKMVQIGLRGSEYSANCHQWQKDLGVKVVVVEECWHKSLVPLMDEVRTMIGPDIPVYISFDIDSLDPSVAPGTGTPELGGLTSIQAMEILRGCKGLNIIGGDMVEVCPAYDPLGTTALIAANLLFEMLCVLPGVKYHKILP